MYNLTCTYSSYVCIGMYYVTLRKKIGKKLQTTKLMYLTSKLPVQ